MNILKFNISGDFAFFKDKVFLRNNHSYPSIHRPALLGILGAILGMDGFSDFKKHNKVMYISELNNKIKIAIKQNSNNEYTEIKYNDSTMLCITSDRSKTIQEIINVLNNPDFDIYLEISDENLYYDLKDRLESLNFVFEPNLGKSYFHLTVNNVETFEDADKKSYNKNNDSTGDSLYVFSTFPTKFLAGELNDFNYKDDFSINSFDIGNKFRLPIQSDENTGMYIENDEFTLKNFIDKKTLLNNGNFKVVNDEILYFF